MLTVESLTYGYDTKAQFSFPSFTLKRGANTLITGPSGTGKTTFLHLMAGLLPAQHGSITINDTIVSALSRDAMDRFRGHYIGLMFQRLHLLPHISVMENLLLACTMAGRQPNHSRANMLLEELSVHYRKDQLASRLSHGEAQRVAIARALINEPLLILADEPTSNLDEVNCARLMTLLINQARRTQATFIVTSHDHRIRQFFPEQIALGKSA